MFIDYICYFIIYSFLGWVCETIYCSVIDKKFINRGFLNGPICPVYGFGAILVIFFLRSFSNDLGTLFIASIILTSTLEYITSLILEIVFKTKWWDYSENKFNIRGRICLLNSTLFGLLSVFLIKIVHVNINLLLVAMPVKIKIIILSVVGIIFLVDFIVTIITILNLGTKLKSYMDLSKDINLLNLGRINLEGNSLVILFRKLEEEVNEEQIITKLSILKEKLTKLKRGSILQRRLFRAFPRMKVNENHEHFKELIKFLKDKNYKI